MAHLMADVEACARLLADLRRDRRQIDALPEELAPADLAEGYAVQDQLSRLLGQRVLGWKVAATNDAAQRGLGVAEPFSGRLLDGAIDASPAAVAPSLLPGRPLLECEVGLRLAAPLRPEGAPCTREQAAGCVGAAVACFELPGSRFTSLGGVGAPSLVADNAVAARLVAGPDVAYDPGMDLAAIGVRLHVNGEVLAEGIGATVLGDPLNSLVWLADHLAARGLWLETGALVSTGALTGLHALRPGDHARAEFTGLGTIEVTFA
ncbi:MAG: 2-keto-4-pentenoate hydratase [Acidimicrobiales bacterium]